MPAIRARSSAQHLRAGVIELPLLLSGHDRTAVAAATGYRDAIRDFYDGAAAKIAAHLEAGAWSR